MRYRDFADKPLEFFTDLSGKRMKKRILAQSGNHRELRGLFHDGVLYLWDAWNAIHHDAAPQIGIPYYGQERIWVTLYSEADYPVVHCADDGIRAVLARRYAGDPDVLFNFNADGMITGKEYLDLIDEPITEEFAFGLKASWHNDPVEIFKNPGPSEFKKLLREIRDMPRALVSQDGDLYVWNADSMHHDEVAMQGPVKMISDASLFINFKKSEVWWHKWEHFRESEDDLYDSWIRPVAAKLFSSRGLAKLFPAGFKLVALDEADHGMWEITPQWIDEHVAPISLEEEAEPKRLIKFWITPQGKIEYLEGREHHLDYLLRAEGVPPWHRVFGSGWIRASLQTQRGELLLAFDKDCVSETAMKAALRFMGEHRPLQVHYDRMDGSLTKGSQTMEPREFRTYAQQIMA